MKRIELFSWVAFVLMLLAMAGSVQAAKTPVTQSPLELRVEELERKVAELEKRSTIGQIQFPQPGWIGSGSIQYLYNLDCKQPAAPSVVGENLDAARKDLKTIFPTKKLIPDATQTNTPMRVEGGK